MSSPYELVGPVLPQALRLARYQVAVPPPKNAQALSNENDVINKTPCREEERLLTSNAHIVVALEDLFSWTSKDRTSRTSRLSRAESIRFQRALYRVWLIYVLCGPHRFAVPDTTNEDYGRRIKDRDKSWKDQTSILQQFSSPELVQIRKVARFLVSIASWGDYAEKRGYTGSGSRGAYKWDDMLLSAGPHAILRCYEDMTSEHLPKEHLTDDGVYEGFLAHALDEIFQVRNVKREPLGFVGSILDNINGESDCCRHCSNLYMYGSGPHAPVLPPLYNETNWDFLRGRLLCDSGFLVPRHLSSNPTDGKAITQALEGDWSRLLHQLFACRGDEYSQWSKQDWICMNCWMTFIEETIWRWRLQQKEKAGHCTKQDCRYGFDCPKQHGTAHAKRFNHLCKPTEKADIPAERW